MSTYWRNRVIGAVVIAVVVTLVKMAMWSVGG